jgi:hypothetical protein
VRVGGPERGRRCNGARGRRVRTRTRCSPRRVAQVLVSPATRPHRPAWRNPPCRSSSWVSPCPRSRSPHSPSWPRASRRPARAHVLDRRARSQDGRHGGGGAIALLQCRARGAMGRGRHRCGGDAVARARGLRAARAGADAQGTHRHERPSTHCSRPTRTRGPPGGDGGRARQCGGVHRPSCIPDAGDAQGEQFSCQANLMANAKVWPAMKQAFEKPRATSPSA